MSDAEFLAAITAAAPADRSAPMLAYADWLRENDQPHVAYAWEWMARRGKFPHYFPQSYVTAEGWGWHGDEKGDGPATLPWPLRPALSPSDHPDLVGCWESLDGAVVALASGLFRLRAVVDLRRESP